MRFLYCPDKVKTSFDNWILESYLTFVLNPQSSIVLWLDETKWKMCSIVILRRYLELVSSEVAKLGMRWNLKWVQIIKMNDYYIINLYESCLNLRNIIWSLDLQKYLAWLWYEILEDFSWLVSWCPKGIGDAVE